MSVALDRVRAPRTLRNFVRRRRFHSRRSAARVPEVALLPPPPPSSETVPSAVLGGHSVVERIASATVGSALALRSVLSRRTDAATARVNSITLGGDAPWLPFREFS